MVNSLIKIIITIGNFLENVKYTYLKWIRKIRDNAQKKLEKSVKKEVQNGDVDDLNDRLMK